MKTFFNFLFFAATLTSICCNKNSTNIAAPIVDTLPADTIPYLDTLPVTTTFFAKGADISWITQMESSGIKFYDKTGTQKDFFKF